MPIYDGCVDEGIRVIDVRHEQTAAHAADGWARVTGRPGVAVVTAGPGLTDAVTGVASAHRANIPMLIIGGQGPAAVRRHGLAAGHEPRRPDAADHQVGASRSRKARRLAEYVSMAFRIATTGVPGPVYLEMPIDQLFDTYEEEQRRFPTGSTAPRRASPAIPRYIDKAFELLQQGAQTAGGAGRQPAALVAAPRRLPRRSSSTFGMPVYVNGLGRGSLPPDHPYFFSQTRKDALKQADVVLIFGTPLDFRLGYGRDSHFNPEAQADPGRPRRRRDRAQPADRRRHRRRHRHGHGATHRPGARPAGLQRRPCVKPWVRRAAPARAAEVGSSMRARDGLRRGADQPAARLQGDRRRPRRATRSSIGDGGDFVATAASVLRIHERALARSRPARHPRRRSGLRHGGQARQAGPHGRHHLRRRRRSACTASSSRRWCARRSTSSASSATTPRGSRSAAARCSSTARSAPWPPALSFTRYEKVVEALGGHGEYVEDARQDPPGARAGARAPANPPWSTSRSAASDFRKDAISI